MTYSNLASTLLHCTLIAGATLGLAACGDDPAGETATDGPTTDSPTTAEPATAGTTTASTGGEQPTTGAPTTGGSDTTDATTTDATTTTTTTDTTTDTSTGEPVTWQPPSCNAVTGTGAVSFSADLGATLAPMDQVIQPVTYTFGLVALGKPGAMLAGSGQKLLASADAGCSWHEIGAGTGPNSPALRLRAAGDTRAYAYGDNDIVIVRVDDEVITKLSSPAGQEGIIGLGVDAGDPDHVRIGDTAGRLWDSIDAGLTWSPIGVAAFADSLGYRAAFDPQDIDHVLFGALGVGVRVSPDGGAGWTGATGLGPGKANGFNLVVSPADGDVVWVEGLDLADPNDATSRHIWRSEDGGLSFAAVVDSDDATRRSTTATICSRTRPTPTSSTSCSARTSATTAPTCSATTTGRRRSR
ncbi:MAG: dispase autolysis-inducing protein [Nannocystis sp.]|nr:hypothetical protein [Nannocystis sp.]MBA3547125.1 dispase autolysis-inducing protein [Nannocystis sp.]